MANTYLQDQIVYLQMHVEYTPIFLFHIVHAVGMCTYTYALMCTCMYVYEYIYRYAYIFKKLNEYAHVHVCVHAPVSAAK